MPHVTGHDGIVILTELCRADGDAEIDRACLMAGFSMIGKSTGANHAACAAGLRQIGNFIRRLTVIGRHPHRTHAEACEHGFEHLVVVGGLHQNAVPLSDAEFSLQRMGHCVDAGFHLSPAPSLFTPDETDMVRVAACRLRQEMREVHHPRGGGRNPARGMLHGTLHRHFTRSMIET